LGESVRFDVARGKDAEARATLERIAKFNSRSLPNGELISETEEPSRGMLDLLKPAHRRISIQLWIMWAMCAFLYYGLSVYTTLLLQSSDDSSHEEVAPSHILTTEKYLSIIITTMSEVPGCIILAFVMDCIGRKPTLAVGFAILSVCIAVMAFSLPSYIIITALFIGRSALGCAWQAAYIYSSEVYPTPLRCSRISSASSWGRVGAMITPITTQMLATLSLSLPAIFFAVGGVVALVLSVLLPVETSPKKAKKMITEH
ncbi:hypothetical protein PENTCL1PPCAC_12928, partial [Pristionchus entomophagus]